MKRLSIVVFVLFMGFISSNAQEYKKIDSCSTMFVYSYQFYEEQNNPESIKKQEMVLERGKKCSKFYSVIKQNMDSMLMLYANETAELAATKLLPTALNQPLPKFASFYVYKNYPEASVTTFTGTDMGTSNYFIVEEKLQFDWQIDNGTKEKIMGYTCTKATCKFAGRDYEAWFTTEIPISDGPYKFRGLPGLIVKISDSKKEHVFELQEVKNVKAKLIYFIGQEYIKTDAKGYVKALEASKAKYIDELKTMISNDETRARATARIQRRNNFIEKY